MLIAQNKQASYDPNHSKGKQMERSDFEFQINRLQCFKRKIDAELVQAYWETLRYVSEPDLRACVTKILQEDRLFPKMPRFKQLLDLIRRGGTLTQSNGPHSQSFHCTICDADFTVVFGTNDKRVIPCEGHGKSNCGRKWSVTELKTRLLDSTERQQSSVEL